MGEDKKEGGLYKTIRLMVAMVAYQASLGIASRSLGGIRFP
jgi:hypothetical protein